MSIKIISKNKIPENLSHLLESGDLTDHQKELWVKYIDFLNEDQIKDLAEFVTQDKVAFEIITEELEKQAKN